MKGLKKSAAPRKRKPNKRVDPKAKVAAKALANKAQVARATGRPMDYAPEFDLLVKKLCYLRATDREVADFFGIAEKNLHAWGKKHQSFRKSMMEGKELADATVAESLFMRATGYKHADTHVSVIDGKVVLTPLTKHYAPDTGAISLWLRNRQPKRWRDTKELEHAGKDGGPIKTVGTMTMTPDEAYRKMLDG